MKRFPRARSTGFASGRFQSVAAPFGEEREALSQAAKHVGRVRKLFPDRAEEVSRLALRSEAFRTICEDYGMAVEALELLENRNLPQDVEKMREYRVLIQDLERELQHTLLATLPHEGKQ